ncbi:MAG: hypothetical protein HUU32_20960 [Calditrichaceae bacterium]|nr:hypothetical protein [Calditrichia bacterium]NUQ43867.1 hypothetical protein [Calditrichaceae bacterium]
MDISLKQILELVGKLNDTPGDDTPRERFRRYLQDNVNQVGKVRDYVEECLRNKGDQYNRKNSKYRLPRPEPQLL